MGPSAHPHFNSRASEVNGGPGGRPRLRHFGSPRRFEPITWLAATVTFAALAVWATGGATLGLDRAALEWLQRPKSPTLDTVAHLLSLLGSEVLGIVHLILLAVLLKRRRWELALGLFVATAGAGLLNGTIKDLFARTRPAEVYGLLPATAGQIYSFPSGHAMVSSAFFYYLGYVSCPFLSGWRRSGTIAGLVLVAVIVGLARTYLGAHWLTDVVAGYLIGFAWAQTVIFGAHLLARRRVRESAAQVTVQSGSA